jgi:hypothetical protein
MLPIPENNQTDIYGDPIDGLLKDDEGDLMADDPLEEVTRLPKWVTILIVITVASMIASTVWWIWFL